MARPAWTKDEDVKQLMKTFYDKNAKSVTQNPSILEAKEKLKEYLAKLKENLQWTCELEYTGSIYEDVKAGSEIEFDIMFVMQNNRNIIAKNTDTGGYFKLINANEERLETVGELATSKVLNKFKSAIQKIINEDSELKQKVRIRDHGPALQLDVYRDVVGRTIWFMVDIVPAYKVQDDIYVAKPLVGRDTTWRISFSRQEKASMQEGGQNGAARRVCLRYVKAMRLNDSALKSLTSYHFKTSLLHLQKPWSDWKQDQHVMDNVIDLLLKVKEFVDRRHMPNYFDRNINLLQDYNDVALSNVSHRIGRLCNVNSKVAMCEILSTKRGLGPSHATCAETHFTFHSASPSSADSSWMGWITSKCVVM